MPDPLSLPALLALIEEATPGPWSFDGYSTLISSPLARVSDEAADAFMPDECNEKSCSACDGEPRCPHHHRYYDEVEPIVAQVVPVAGDTATGRDALTKALRIAVEALDASTDARGDRCCRQCERNVAALAAVRELVDLGEKP